MTLTQTLPLLWWPVREIFDFKVSFVVLGGVGSFQEMGRGGKWTQSRVLGPWSAFEGLTVIRMSSHCICLQSRSNAKHQPCTVMPTVLSAAPEAEAGGPFLNIMLYFKNSLFLYAFIVCRCTYTRMPCGQRTIFRSQFFLPSCGPRDWTWVVRLGAGAFTHGGGWGGNSLGNFHFKANPGNLGRPSS